MSHYSSDLAYVHNTHYGDFARKAAVMIIKSLKNHGINKGLIIDLGCGSGILAQKLLAAGYDIFGIDQSQAFIELARKHEPKGTFVQASFFDVILPSCVGVVSTGECLNYLFDKKNSEDTLQQLFKKVFAALQNGGLFIFDILEPSQQNPREYKRIIETDDWTMFLHVSENTRDQTLTRHITLFTNENNLYRKTTEVHKVQLYQRQKINNLLQNSGFNVEQFDRYDDLQLGETHPGFCCKKA